jgi:hypothetical protein
MIQVDQCFSALLWRYGLRLPGCRFLCRHIAPDPAQDVVPATSLTRSNALHSAQKPTVPPTHEIFGLTGCTRTRTNAIEHEFAT